MDGPMDLSVCIYPYHINTFYLQKQEYKSNLHNATIHYLYPEQNMFLSESAFRLFGRERST